LVIGGDGAESRGAGARDAAAAAVGCAEGGFASAGRIGSFAFRGWNVIPGF